MIHVDVLLMTPRQLRLGRCQQRAECKTLDFEAKFKIKITRTKQFNEKSVCALYLRIFSCFNHCKYLISSIFIDY